MCGCLIVYRLRGARSRNCFLNLDVFDPLARRFEGVGGLGSGARPWARPLVGLGRLGVASPLVLPFIGLCFVRDFPHSILKFY